MIANYDNRELPHITKTEIVCGISSTVQDNSITTSDSTDDVYLTSECKNVYYITNNRPVDEKEVIKSGQELRRERREQKRKKLSYKEKRIEREIMKANNIYEINKRNKRR